MNIDIKHIDEHEVELTIKVPWPRIQDDYDELLRRYAKVPLNGFREGKTPLKLIEAMFKQEIKSDFASMASPRIVREAAQQCELEIGSPVEVTEVKIYPDEQYCFNARFLKMPEFTLPDYLGLSLESADDEALRDEISLKLLERTPVDVPDKMIEKELALSGEESAGRGTEVWKAASQRVKLLMILKKIASGESIEVDEKDVDERIKHIAQENNMKTSEMKEYFLSNGAFSRLQDYILAEQVFDYLIERSAN